MADTLDQPDGNAEPLAGKVIAWHSEENAR